MRFDLCNFQNEFLANFLLAKPVSVELPTGSSMFHRGMCFFAHMLVIPLSMRGRCRAQGEHKFTALRLKFYGAPRLRRLVGGLDNLK